MINLLPAKIKKEQKLKQTSKQVNIAMLAIFVMISMAYTAVYFVNFFLGSQLDDRNVLLAQVNNELTRLKPIEESIDGVNSKLVKLSSLKTNRYEWSSAIADLNKSVPAQVQIQTLAIDQKTNKISLTAAAETRSDIVKLQAGLEDLPYFKNLAFDSSTYNSSNNYYTFNMTGTIGK